MPPRSVLVLLLALATVPPFAARVLHTPVGDFAMFSRIGRYRVELSVLESGGRVTISRAELAPHLSRDARFVVLPASGQGFGDDQADLLAGGLADLGRLLCELRPAASSAVVRLGRAPLGEDGLHWSEAQVSCRRQ